MVISWLESWLRVVDAKAQNRHAQQEVTTHQKQYLGGGAEGEAPEACPQPSIV